MLLQIQQLGYGVTIKDQALFDFERADYLQRSLTDVGVNAPLLFQRACVHTTSAAFVRLSNDVGSH